MNRAPGKGKYHENAQMRKKLLENPVENGYKERPQKLSYVTVKKVMIGGNTQSLSQPHGSWTGEETSIALDGTIRFPIMIYSPKCLTFSSFF